MKHTHIIVEVP